jgi:hypothetical protein
MSSKLKKTRHNPLGDDIQRDREPFDFAKQPRRKERAARRDATSARQVSANQIRAFFFFFLF